MKTDSEKSLEIIIFMNLNNNYFYEFVQVFAYLTSVVTSVKQMNQKKICVLKE